MKNLSTPLRLAPLPAKIYAQTGSKAPQILRAYDREFRDMIAAIRTQCDKNKLSMQ